MSTLKGVSEFFPLVPRPRPVCLPLPTRIHRLRDLSLQPPPAGSAHQQLTRAAEVCNLVALLASDCGLPFLARTLCRQQYQAFEQARPFPAEVASLALQPLLNIPRQMIRNGHGESAVALLHALYQAARTGDRTVIDGHPVHLRGLVDDEAGQKTIITLVWTALLADGTRALTQAGRWSEAAAQLAAHRGIGTRLLDGRQVAILDAAHHGRYEQAAELLDRSDLHESWEHAVSRLLLVQSRLLTGHDTRRHIPGMLADVLALLRQADPAATVFQVRSAIIALELADTHRGTDHDALTQRLIELAFQDGYAARDLLAHPYLTDRLLPAQRQALTDLTRTCGLGLGMPPAGLHEQILAIAEHGEQRLRSLLGVTQKRLPWRSPHAAESSSEAD